MPSIGKRVESSLEGCETFFSVLLGYQIVLPMCYGVSTVTMSTFLPKKLFYDTL